MQAKILYVDDEDDIREIAKISLELEPDFEVRLSSSGERAIDEAATWQPDLVLLDVMMPGMDGPETLRQLAAGQRTSAIPVAFVTARTQTHQVERYLAMGAVGVIPKPFDPMQLACEVKELLRAHGRTR
jgi:CheY-like chemotaxis protein